MLNVLNYLRARFASKKGQGMVEYGLILGGIAVAVVAAVGLFGGQLGDFMTKLGEYIGALNPTPAP